MRLCQRSSHREPHSTRRFRPETISLALVCVVGAFTIQPASSQTFSVIHAFSGGADGAVPTGGLTLAPGGALYGTTTSGGTGGSGNNGVVFKIAPHSSGWVLNALFEFNGNNGKAPSGGVAIGPSGALYGLTSTGGPSNAGVVYELQPPFSICQAVTCYWSQTILHNFTALDDGGFPGYGTPIFDGAGNLYATAELDGAQNGGVVFKLSRSGNQWTETILHDFGGGEDGVEPDAGLVFDASGSLYGTTLSGGINQCQGSFCGTVFQLVPQQDGSWHENVLFNFNTLDAGSYPTSTLVLDQAGNFYGTTSSGGSNNGGTVFELSPANGWTFSVLNALPAGGGQWCTSLTGVSRDAAGNLYGVCSQDGASNQGLVFKLTLANGNYTFHDLHDFTGGTDGGSPVGGVVLDANGNLYGTAAYGGNTSECGGNGCGVIWEIAGVAGIRD